MNETAISVGRVFSIYGGLVTGIGFVLFFFPKQPTKTAKPEVIAVTLSGLLLCVLGSMLVILSVMLINFTKEVNK